MTNPFEDATSDFFALVNDEGQHSLWPSHIDVPAGWSVVHGPAERGACVAYVDAHWTDMRPASLAKAEGNR